MSSRVELSIVIVNWNAGDQLQVCVSSIVENPPSCSWELILVDNGSTDGSADAAMAACPSALVVPNRTNRGRAAANNQGLIAASGEAIVLSDPTVTFLPGTLDAFRSVLARRRSAGLVVPQVRSSNGRPRTMAGNLPTLNQALLRRQFPRHRARDGEPRGILWDGQSHDEEREVGRANDVCYAARRAAIAAVGLQDESFRLDCAAMDWSARFREEGWSIVFAPTAAVIQHADASASLANRRRQVIGTHRGMYLYFAKKRSSWARPALAALFVARAVLKLMPGSAGLAFHERAPGPLRCDQLVEVGRRVDSPRSTKLGVDTEG